MVSAGREPSVRVWKVGQDGASVVHRIDARTGDVNTLGVSDDGSRLLLKKLDEGYDPTDKIAALRTLHEASRRGEFATGLIYIEPDRDDFLNLLNVVDEPLATLPLERTRPPKAALDEIMESLR